MCTKKDLIKLSAGNYKLVTDKGVWLLSKNDNRTWSAIFEDSSIKTQTSKTLTKLIEAVEAVEAVELDELTEEQYKSDELFYSYDSEVPLISNYNPISFSEAITNATFNLVHLFASAANFVAKYQLIRIAFVLILAYFATYFAPIAYNSVKITILTILPFILVCVKMSVISLPFIATHYVYTNKLLS